MMAVVFSPALSKAKPESDDYGFGEPKAEAKKIKPGAAKKVC